MAQSGGSGAFKVGGLLIGGIYIGPFVGTIDTSGSDATWAGTVRATPGSILIDRTGLKVYINTGSKASPTWTVVGNQS
jgi:hypothetical protein